MVNFGYHFSCHKVGVFIEKVSTTVYRFCFLFVFPGTDCEHLIRHMLVVEPERRMLVDQIARHRWMSAHTAYIEETREAMQCSEPTTLDTVVITHMLQLPNLTFDEIAESVHQRVFNHIYAIYNLLVDKLSTKRKEQQRIQYHATLTQSRYTILSFDTHPHRNLYNLCCLCVCNG